jgi:hypothetical protein
VDGVEYFEPDFSYDGSGTPLHLVSVDYTLHVRINPERLKFG